MRILFITTTKCFEQFSGEYDVSSSGVLPSLAVAAAVLDNENIIAPEAVLIGADIQLPKVIRFIRQYSTTSALKQTRWLVVTDPSTSFMASELGGIAKTIEEPQLSPAILAQMLGIRRTKAVRTIFISAINIKGGTGKTTFLTNYAYALARRGLRTAIIDADVVDGDVAQALGVPGESGTIDKLAAELSKPEAKKGALLKHFLYPHSKNLFIIPAPGRSDYGQDYLNEITAQVLLNMLASARFDAVLVDLPGHLRSTPFTQALARQAISRFFLLYHPDKVFERAGFSRALQVLQGLGAQNKASIIALGSEENGLWTSQEQDAIEGSTHLKVTTFLPYDPLVRQSQQQSKTVYEMLDGKLKSVFGKGSPYAQGIEKLADSIIENRFGEQQ